MRLKGIQVMTIVLAMVIALSVSIVAQQAPDGGGQSPRGGGPGGGPGGAGGGRGPSGPYIPASPM